MSPSSKSLLAVSLASVFYIILLLMGTNSTSSGDFSSPDLIADQLSAELSNNVNSLAEGLKTISSSSVWQNSPESEWSQQLSNQSGIFKTAGLSFLVIHSQATNQYYTNGAIQDSSMSTFQDSLARAYKKGSSVRALQEFEQQPALVFVQPIKTVTNKIIGNLVGVKMVDKKLLGRYHYLSRHPVATFKADELLQSSLESSPSLDEYKEITIDWPSQLNSTNWELKLLIKESSQIGGSALMIFLAIIATLGCLFVVWQQSKAIQGSLIALNKTLNIDLPITEQIKRLGEVQHLGNDLNLLDCAQSIRTRLEQLSQQKKSLGIEVRKLQESQDQLQQVKSSIENERDSAVAAPRLKSEFLSRMGDEITTPMKSVVSMLKLLSEYHFEPEPKQLLTIAKRSTRTLVNNLNNILDFSKLDAEMLRLKPKRFSVRELVDELSSELSHFAKEKSLSLQASSTPEMPELITADEYRIKQIIRNLLGNAIRFTQDGEVSLYADLSTQGSKKLLRFTISDTGIGISPAAQKELFDSLEQTTKLSNSSFTGRLRLIVSKRLAELMGGEIGVVSEINKGSQFWFTVTFKE